MNVRLLACLLLWLTVFCATGQELTTSRSSTTGYNNALKLEGPVLGFMGLRHPLRHWFLSRPEDRLTGSLSKICSWEHIARIQVLYGMLHIRVPGDVEAYVKEMLEGGEFVSAPPWKDEKNVPRSDAPFTLQALLQLKDGTWALLSVPEEPWLVLEMQPQHKVGLIRRH